MDPLKRARAIVPQVPRSLINHLPDSTEFSGIPRSAKLTPLPFAHLLRRHLAGFGALILDNQSRMRFSSAESAGIGPATRVTVSSATTIDQIGALLDLNSSGQLRFFLFNHSGATLFLSDAKNVTDDGMSYKESDVFPDVTLQPGIGYTIEAIANVGASWRQGTSQSNYVENGITVGTTFSLITNFNSPIVGGVFPGMGSLRLSNSSSEVPEPTSMLLSALGLLSLASLRRLRRS
jgi:hypothetical protein